MLKIQVVSLKFLKKPKDLEALNLKVWVRLPNGQKGETEISQYDPSLKKAMFSEGFQFPSPDGCPQYLQIKIFKCLESDTQEGQKTMRY